MLKDAYPHFSMLAVVFALSVFYSSQSTGGGLGWPGGEECGTTTGPTTQEPVTLDPLLQDVVDTVGNFKAPVRLDLSSSGDLYVSDHDKGLVYIYDATGKGIGMLKGLTAPLGVAVYDPPEPSVPAPPDYCSGRVKLTKEQKKECKWWGAQPEIELPPPPQSIIYVGDDGNGSVKVFNSEDVSVLGSGSGEFISPNGIAVTEGQSVYVVDSKAHQVKVYDNFGALQFSFGSEGCADGQLDFPIDIVLNETVGEVYVSDFRNKRVAVFNLLGDWLRNISTPENDGGDPAYFRPSGLGIDPDGNLYVVDHALSCVVIMTNTGALIDIIGYSNGQYWTGNLTLPHDAAADGQHIYVISSQDQVVKIFNGVVP